MTLAPSSQSNYPPVIKHGLQENPPFIDDYPIKGLDFYGMSEPAIYFDGFLAMFDDTGPNPHGSHGYPSRRRVAMFRGWNSLDRAMMAPRDMRRNSSMEGSSCDDRWKEATCKKGTPRKIQNRFQILWSVADYSFKISKV